MNRRDFVKALAGIPLLGLLVKLPKGRVPYHEIDVFNGASHTVDLTWDNAERLKAICAELQAEAIEQPPYQPDGYWPPGSLVITFQESTGQYVESMWNGKGWERRLIDTLDVCSIA